jgi:hypothetical protein
MLAARDFFDANLARAVVLFVRANLSNSDIGTHCVLRGFNCASYRFDALLLLAPDVHKLLEIRRPSLQPFVIQAIPIYSCEFTGDETPEMLYTLRKRFVSTLDWKRVPSPRIMASFSTGTVKTPAKLGLISLPDVLFYLQEIRRLGDGFGRVCNYLGELIQITYAASSGNYQVGLSDRSTLLIPATEMDDWLMNFVCRLPEVA